MGRRFLATICAIAIVCPAVAQQSAPVRKVGVVTLGVPASSPYMAAFRRALRDQGYVEGRNISIEQRFAGGESGALPALAGELVRLNVSVIVTESAPATLAASRATKTIPIVMALGPDPTSLGLAASLSRPGGNVTGVSLGGASRTAKQLQLLKESVPGATTVAVIYNATRPGIEAELKEAREKAPLLGVSLQFAAVRSPGDLEMAFEAIVKQRPSALITVGDGMLLGNSGRIAAFAMKNGLPAVFPEREFAERGGLMAYGPDLADNFVRAAAIVDKILKGANPADIPIEHPRKWGLVINFKTAKAMGLKIPSPVLARADEVIQ